MAREIGRGGEDDQKNGAACYTAVASGFQIVMYAKI